MGHCKTVLSRRVNAIKAYLKKQKRSQINNQTLQLKELEKKQMKNTRVRIRKEIIKIRAEINENETKVTLGKINKAKICFIEKINKIDKPLTRLIKKKNNNVGVGRGIKSIN